MASQLPNHILTCAAFIHQTDKGGPKLTIGHILGHVPANASMNLLHPAHIAPGGDKGRFGIALDIHKYRANDHDAHGISPFVFVYYSMIPWFFNKKVLPKPHFHFQKNMI